MSVISWLFHRRPDYDPRRAQHQRILDAQVQQSEWSSADWHEGDGYIPHYYPPGCVTEEQRIEWDTTWPTTAHMVRDFYGRQARELAKGEIVEGHWKA